MKYLITSLMIFQVSCSLFKKNPSDGTSFLINMDANQLEKCAELTLKKIKKSDHVLFVFDEKSQKRILASADSCKSAAKIVDGKVHQFYLFPKGTTLNSARSPCGRYFKNCRFQRNVERIENRPNQKEEGGVGKKLQKSLIKTMEKRNWDL